MNTLDTYSDVQVEARMNVRIKNASAEALASSGHRIMKGSSLNLDWKKSNKKEITISTGIIKLISGKEFQPDPLNITFQKARISSTEFAVNGTQARVTTTKVRNCAKIFTGFDCC